MTLVPLAEWKPDISGLNSTFASDVQNVLVNGAGYMPAPSLASLTDALEDNSLGGFRARQLDGTITIFAGTATKLFRLDNTDLSWVDVSKADTTYNANSTALWDFNQFGDYVIAVNQNDDPQVFQLGVDTAFRDLGGSPPRAGKVKIWGDFVVLMQLTSNLDRAQWSGLNDAEFWTPGQNNSDYQTFPDGGVVQGSTEQTNPLIFQEHAIRLATFVPGSTEIFTFQKIHDLRGAKSASAIAYRGDYAFFADEGGFFQIGSDGSLSSIGFEKVDRTFFSALAAADISRIWGAVDPFYSRVYWAINLAGADLYDTLLVYDWNLQRWSKITATVQNLIPLATTGYTLESLDDVSSSLDALPFSLDSKVWQGGAPILGAFDANNKLASFSGPSMKAVMTTQETGDTAGSISLIQSLYPVVDANSFTMAIGSRMKRGDAVQWTDELSPNAVTGRVDKLNAARFQRVRVTIPANTDWTIAESVDVTTKAAGRR